MKPRRSDIPQLALEARRLGELLITPCPCRPTGHQWLTAHTIGEHLHDATHDMNPGPQAQAFEPHTTSHTGLDPDRDPQSAPDLHARYLTLLAASFDTTRQLQTFVDTYRPDRTMPTGPTFTDTDWCTNHLTVLGICEPRYRGDLCRRCYGVHLTTGHLPPPAILDAWRDGTRITDTTLRQAITAHHNTKARKGKRKRAS